MAIERKPLKKAPARDVVEAFTANPDSPQAAIPAAQAAGPAVARAGSRGPGRPRSKRRMEPFSSKIEIGLRDEVDAYLAKSGGTIIDFLDEALRDRLAK